MNQDVTLLGSFGSDIGVGWISHGLKIFRKSTRKQIMLTKNALEHAKRILARAGPKVDATVTEQNVDATVNSAHPI